MPDLIPIVGFAGGGIGIVFGCTLLVLRLRGLRGRDNELPPVRQIVGTLASSALVFLIAFTSPPR